MPDQIDTQYIAETARAATEGVSAEVQEVHGPLWDARESLAKLVVSLSSASLTTNCPILVVISWFLLFLALISSVISLWFSTNLKSFRVRHY